MIKFSFFSVVYEALELSQPNQVYFRCWNWNFRYSNFHVYHRYLTILPVA